MKRRQLLMIPGTLWLCRAWKTVVLREHKAKNTLWTRTMVRPKCWFWTSENAALGVWSWRSTWTCESHLFWQKHSKSHTTFKRKEENNRKKWTWPSRNRRRREHRAFDALTDRRASGNEISRALNQSCCVSRFTAMSGLLVLLTTGLLYLCTSAHRRWKRVEPPREF